MCVVVRRQQPMGMPDTAPLGWPWSIVPAQCFAPNEMACRQTLSSAALPVIPSHQRLTNCSGRANVSKSAQEL